MGNYKYNPVLLALIGLGLIAALCVGWQRHVIEENNSRVEMVMDYDDVAELAQTEGLSTADAMSRFKAAGITSLAVYETTLEQLQKNGKLAVVPGADLLARYRTGELINPLFAEQGGQIDPAKVYIFVGRQEPGGPGLFAEVKEDLGRRLGPDRVREFTATDSRLAMVVDANYETILKWNLGLPSDEMREVAAQGLYIVARPSNYTKVQLDDIDAVLARLAPFSASVSGVMFVGEEALGYPNLLPEAAKRLNEQGLTVYMIEHPLQLQFVKQEGLLSLVAAARYQAARVYVISKEEQLKLELAVATHRWRVADEERNIRVNLLRKFTKTAPGLSLFETNLKYVRDVTQSVAERDFTLGRAGTFQSYFPSPLLLAAIVVGATAAGVLFLTLLWPFAPRYQYLRLIILAALLIWPLFAGSGTLARQATALVSAVIFPVLAVTRQLDCWREREPYRGSSLRRILVDGLGGLVVTTLLAIIGGFYIGGILGDIRFMLEMEIFRGVKLTFVLPLVLITMVYVVRYHPFAAESINGPWGMYRQLKRILDYPVQLKTLALVGLGVVAAWIFVGRSGHTAGIPVPGIEIKVRAFLEDTLYARPREKEFFIGHPAFFLAVVALYRQWPRILHYLLVVAITIGQGSLVETFCHIRTPIYMSFVRGIHGLWLGAALGVLAVIAVQVLHYLSYLLGRRPAADE